MERVSKNVEDITAEQMRNVRIIKTLPKEQQREVAEKFGFII